MIAYSLIISRSFLKDFHYKMEKFLHLVEAAVKYQMQITAVTAGNPLSPMDPNPVTLPNPIHKKAVTASPIYTPLP